MLNKGYSPQIPSNSLKFPQIPSHSSCEGSILGRPWRIMLKNFVIMLCSNALKCFDYASKDCYYAHGMLAL